MIPGEARCYYFHQLVHTDSGNHPASYSGCKSVGVLAERGGDHARQGHGADHSLVSNYKIKNAWNCYYAPIHLHNPQLSCTGINCPKQDSLTTGSKK
jgi:hypothetical protein